MKNAFALMTIFAMLFSLSLGCKIGALSASKDKKSKCAANLPALDSSEKYAARGMKASSEGGDDCALDDCEKALELNPENREALVCRGSVLMKREEFERAENDFNAAIELSPNDALALYGRSRLYRRTKRLDKALTDINKVVELLPADYYFAARGEIFAELNDDENALKDYAEAIRQKPATANYYEARAAVYRRTGRIDLAEADAKKYRELKDAAEEKNSLGKSDETDDAIINDLAVSLPKPVYPPAARAVKASGKVRVLISVDARGNVASAQAISGHPFLRAAAEQAAKQAKFKPSAIERGILIFDFAV